LPAKWPVTARCGRPGLLAGAGANRRITPAGEWLLDNVYLIEEQTRTAKWVYVPSVTSFLRVVALSCDPSQIVVGTVMTRDALDADGLRMEEALVRREEIRVNL
jgi:hypothetical protein